MKGGIRFYSDIQLPEAHDSATSNLEISPTISLDLVSTVRLTNKNSKLENHLEVIFKAISALKEADCKINPEELANYASIAGLDSQIKDRAKIIDSWFSSICYRIKATKYDSLRLYYAALAKMDQDMLKRNSDNILECARSLVFRLKNMKPMGVQSLKEIRECTITLWALHCSLDHLMKKGQTMRNEVQKLIAEVHCPLDDLYSQSRSAYLSGMTSEIQRRRGLLFDRERDEALPSILLRSKEFRALENALNGNWGWSFPKSDWYIRISDFRTNDQWLYMFHLADCLFRPFQSEEGRTIKTVLVRGKPGSGKSAMTRHIACLWAKSRWGKGFKRLYWIGIDAVGCNGKKISKEGIIEAAIFRSLMSEVPLRDHKSFRESIESDLKEETTLLVLDGFDGSELSRALIDEATSPDSQISLLVTSRYGDHLDYIMDKFDKTVECEGLTNDQIERYVKSLDFDSNDLIAEFRRSKTLKEICQTPQYLNSVVSLWKKVHEDGGNRESWTVASQMHQICFDMWMEYTRGHPEIDIDFETLCSIMEDIAFALAEKEETYLTETTLDTSYIESQAEKEMVIGAGFLVRRAFDQNYYFPHYEFQKYFAGRMLASLMVDECTGKDQLQVKCNQMEYSLPWDHWTETLNKKGIVAEESIRDFDCFETWANALMSRTNNLDIRVHQVKFAVADWAFSIALRTASDEIRERCVDLLERIKSSASASDTATANPELEEMATDALRVIAEERAAKNSTDKDQTMIEEEYGMVPVREYASRQEALIPILHYCCCVRTVLNSHMKTEKTAIASVFDQDPGYEAHSMTIMIRNVRDNLEFASKLKTLHHDGGLWTGFSSVHLLTQNEFRGHKDKLGYESTFKALLDSLIRREGPSEIEVDSGNTLLILPCGGGGDHICASIKDLSDISWGCSTLILACDRFLTDSHLPDNVKISLSEEVEGCDGVVVKNAIDLFECRQDVVLYSPIHYQPRVQEECLPHAEGSVATQKVVSKATLSKEEIQVVEVDSLYPLEINIPTLSPTTTEHKSQHTEVTKSFFEENDTEEELSVVLTMFVQRSSLMSNPESTYGRNFNWTVSIVLMEQTNDIRSQYRPAPVVLGQVLEPKSMSLCLLERDHRFNIRFHSIPKTPLSDVKIGLKSFGISCGQPRGNRVGLRVKEVSQADGIFEFIADFSLEAKQLIAAIPTRSAQLPGDTRFVLDLEVAIGCKDEKNPLVYPLNGEIALRLISEESIVPIEKAGTVGDLIDPGCVILMGIDRIGSNKLPNPSS